MAEISPSSKVAYMYDAGTGLWYAIAGVANTNVPYTWTQAHVFGSVVTVNDVIRAKGGVNRFQNPTARDSVITSPQKGTVCFVEQTDGGTDINQVQIYNGTSWVGMLDTTTFNNQTSDYTLVLGDAGKTILVNSTSDIVITVPSNDSVPFSVGQRIDIIRMNTGNVTIDGEPEILSKDSSKEISSRYSRVILIKTDTDTWILIGDLVEPVIPPFFPPFFPPTFTAPFFPPTFTAPFFPPTFTSPFFPPTFGPFFAPAPFFPPFFDSPFFPPTFTPTPFFPPFFPPTFTPTPFFPPFFPPTFPPPYFPPPYFSALWGGASPFFPPTFTAPSPFFPPTFTAPPYFPPPYFSALWGGGSPFFPPTFTAPFFPPTFTAPAPFFPPTFTAPFFPPTFTAPSPFFPPTFTSPAPYFPPPYFSPMWGSDYRLKNDIE